MGGGGREANLIGRDARSIRAEKTVDTRINEATPAIDGACARRARRPCGSVRHQYADVSGSSADHRDGLEYSGDI